MQNCLQKRKNVKWCKIMNKNLINLYNCADAHNVEVISIGSRKAECMSFMDANGECSIGINPMMLACDADEIIKLAHELGHCISGAFYNEYSTLDIRRKHERRADKWAIKKLIPKDELKDACKHCTNRYELSEYFGVTEDFMQKALDYYLE